MSTADKHEIVPVSTYLAVFAALMILTVITVWISTIDLGDMNVVVALVVATIKAVLVLLFFMHLRHGSRLLWVVLGSSFFFLALLIGLTMSDVLTRGRWDPMGPNLPGFSLSAPGQAVPAPAMSRDAR
jgi:cytochrome c oxidase subunit 4